MTLPPAMNVASLLNTAADGHRSSLAVVEGEATTTYGDLAARAGAVAAALATRGIRRGDRVGIVLPRGADAAAAYFGVVSLGAVAVPLNEMYRPWQVQRALSHSGAAALISRSDVARGDGELPPAVLMEDIAVAAMLEPVDCAPDHPAHLVFTSGSTGQPKAVVVSHRNVLHGTRTVTAYLGVREDDRVISMLPFSFVYGFSQLMTAVSAAARLVVIRAVFAQDIVEQVARSGGTVLASVPAGWAQLLRVATFDGSLCPRLRVITCAGGRLPVPAVRELRHRFPEAALFLMYGLTEAFRSTFLPPDEVDEFPHSMGRAVPGSEVLVVREDGSLCEAGEVGELVHIGPTVALGYWQDPAATDAVFRPDPRPGRARDGRPVVFSGDLVHRDETGRLFHVGRRDYLIKTMGYRVSPDEVGDALLASGLVQEVAAIGEPDAERGERIVAHVVYLPGGDEASVRRHARATLPTYMQPGRYVVHQALPRTTNGKLDLVALREASAPEW